MLFRSPQHREQEGKGDRQPEKLAGKGGRVEGREAAFVLGFRAFGGGLVFLHGLAEQDDQGDDQAEQTGRFAEREAQQQVGGLGRGCCAMKCFK